MTSEEFDNEIASQLFVLLHTWQERPGGPSYYDHCRSVLEFLARHFASQAYEEAKAAICEGCRAGWPYLPALMRHGGPGGSQPQCDAWRLRDLTRFGHSAIERLLPLQDELNKAGMLQ